MQNLYLLALMALLLLVSCTEDEPIPVPPVNEYLVVSNSKGYRDDFINQADHVIVSDSALRVRSLRAVDSYRDYPIIDGYLQGSSDPALHWLYETIGADTITLTDTSRNSVFYLQRMTRVDSLPAALGLITSGELVARGVERFMGELSSDVFNDFGQGAGCLVNRGYYGYRDWSKMSGVFKEEDQPKIEYYLRTAGNKSLWRYYERFAQPILVVESLRGGLMVVLLDSLSTNQDTLFGKSIRSQSFDPPRTYTLVRSTPVNALNEADFALLSGPPDTVTTLPEDIRDRHRRRWENDEDPASFLVVEPEQLKDLRLRFSPGDKITFGTKETDLISASYKQHETAPYLVLGDDCDGQFYWHYERRGDSLTVRIPLRIQQYPDLKPRTYTVDGKEITMDPGRWYVNDEWRATYVAKDQEEETTK